MACDYTKLKELRGSVSLAHTATSATMCSNFDWVDAVALSTLPVRRVHAAISSSGRCFCCQYLVNLHRALHSPGGKLREERIRIELEPRFWQNTEVADVPPRAQPASDSEEDEYVEEEQVEYEDTEPQKGASSTHAASCTTV